MSKQHKAIAVDLITITSESGLIGFDKPVKCSTWEEADEWLRRIAYDAPKGGCYDKTWFAVTLCNGKKYEGRIDIHHIDEKQETSTGRLTLLDHMRDNLMYSLRMVKENPGYAAYTNLDATRFWTKQVLAHAKCA